MAISNSENSQRIAKNTILLFFRMFLVVAVSLYTSRVVLATLGVEDYGLYNVVGGVVVLFGFLQQALNNATYRYLAYAIGEGVNNKLQKVFSMALNSHFILAGIIMVLGETIGLWILNTKLVVPESRMLAANWVYHVSLFSCCLNIIKTPYNSSIIAHEKMNFYAYTSIIEVILKLAIVFLLVIGGIDKLILYSLLTAGVTMIMLFWYYVQCNRLFDECKYRKCWDGTLIKNMVRYSGLSIIVNMVDVGVSQSIVFFFNVFVGLVANAALGVANQVNAQLTAFLGSFTQAYTPQIIKSYASGDKDYFMKLIFSSSKFSYYLLFFVAIPILLNIDFILNLWLQNPPEGAGNFFALIVCYSLVDAYSAPLWTGVHATGNLKVHQLLMASIKILNIPISYILLKNGFPSWTALVVLVILNIICSIVRPCYVKHLYGLILGKYFKNVFCVVYGVTILILPIPFYLSCYIPDGWMKLFVTSIVFVMIAIPIIYVVGLNNTEKCMLKNMIISKVKTYTISK